MSRVKRAKRRGEAQASAARSAGAGRPRLWMLAGVLILAVALASCASGHGRGTGAHATSPSPRGTTQAPNGRSSDSAQVTVRHPCKLVTQAEAQSALGIPLRPLTEAPLGPTCIFESEQGNIAATLAVEQASVDQLRSRLPQMQATITDGHQGYCGTYGKPTLFVSLTKTSLLVVSAGCGQAEKLATDALAHIAFPS